MKGKLNGRAETNYKVVANASFIIDNAVVLRAKINKM
jgi:hypothetical protein